ncbi:MAG: TrkH family potassium uptake protein [Spirochaetales bacterium]
MTVRLIARFTSVLVTVVSLFMIIPLLISIVEGEDGTAAAFIIPIAVSAIVASIIIPLTSGSDYEFSPRSSYLMVTVGWLAAALVGAVPFLISGAIPSFVDAFFESISGFTTTGASILVDIEALPRSILFWRSMTHWLGGMGIIVLMVAIFPLLGLGGRALVMAEAPWPTVDKITPRITETAKILWILYLSLTIAQTVLLMAGGLDWFDALTHTFGTVATGGFSPYNDSIGHFDSAYVEWVVLVFMLLAAGNFLLYYRIVTGRALEVRFDSELRAYIGIVALGTIALTVILTVARPEFDSAELAWLDWPVLTRIRQSGFHIATILTTTGYVAGDYELWPYGGQAILFIMMFIGGSAGSTGGGVKIARIVVLAKQALHEVRYLLYPRGVFTLRFNSQPVRKNVVYAIVSFVVLYIIVALAGTVMSMLAGADLATGISSSLATLGNIGPGFGEVGPTGNYEAFPGAAKLFFSFLMLAGRLEIYTVIILFTPAFWRE